MSQGEPMPHAVALAAAERVIEWLRPGCERIEIAGSLRRQKPMVRDMEIVAVARWDDRGTGDLWGSMTTVDVLEERVAALMASGYLAPRDVVNHRADGSLDVQHKLGPAFKALITADATPLDLFIVRPPASWGVIFGLRTGPGDWNTRLVDECKAIGRRVSGGQVESWTGTDWATVPTPEEPDFFRAIGQSWIEPHDRHVSRVRVQRELANA